MRWCLLLYAMTACMRVESTPGTGTQHTITLTIDRRATVRDTSSLQISISSAGTTTTDTVVTSEFPLFHTVTADGLIGRVDISVDALDDAGKLVGRGETTTDANAGRAAVMVQGADFLLNSSYTGDQLLTNDFDAAGVQLAATSDAWTVAFRDECTSCGIYARRFDASGFPLASGGSTAQLTMSSVPTRPDANPAVAAGAADSLVVWDFTDLSTPDTQGVACRPLAQSSEPGPGQQTIASEVADVVTALALASGNFVVTWTGFMTTSTIRSMIVRPDCSAVTSPTTISSPVGVKGPYRAHAATNAAALLYTWIVDGDLHVRAGHDDGTFTSSERVLVYHGAADEIEQARIAPWRDDFAVAARWSATFSGGSGPRLELYRVSTEGQILAAPIAIAEMSRSDTASDRAFGIAQRADGMILVVWHSCPTGPGSCNVLGRFVGGDGVATTDGPLVIPTTVTGDQTDPSVTVVGDAFVVAWTDASASAPDTSGAAVRARILIPAP